MRILIAEDDGAARLLLHRHLESWGHTVVAARDGLEAWTLFEQDEFPLVISDWMMPGIDGLELVRRIRGQGRSRYTYIILLTVHSGKEDIVVGMKAGADDFIVKPFDQFELRARLQAGERIIQLEQKLSGRNEELERANAQISVINQRMKNDLQMAARVQQALLPQKLPEIPGVNFAWTFQPCDELAGDILNVFRLDEKHVGLYVLDVSEHGIPAALLAVTISRLLSPLMSQSSVLKKPIEDLPRYSLVRPAQVGAQLNRQFPMMAQSGQYFTLIYGVLDLETREFTYLQAGHPSPLYLPAEAGKIIVLEGAGLPVGFLEDAAYEEYCLPLRCGDRLYLYSDGISEARNSAGEQFSTERMMEILETARSLRLKDTLSLLMERTRRWCGPAGLKDDISLLAVEIE